jgi:hypothetical protein
MENTTNKLANWLGVIPRVYFPNHNNSVLYQQTFQMYAALIWSMIE